MKKAIKLLLVLTLFVGFTSCNKDKAEEKIETICNVVNPLEDLAWLHDIKTMFEVDGSTINQSITHYIYDNNDVFLIQDCIGCGDAWDYVLDCQGKRLCDFGSIAGLDTCPGFFEEATLVSVIYEE